MDKRQPKTKEALLKAKAEVEDRLRTATAWNRARLLREREALKRELGACTL